MKWDIEKSNMLKEKIAENEELMTKLSSMTDKILKKHNIKLNGFSYVFEPRVFQIDLHEIPEVMMKSRAAMVAAISDDLVGIGSGASLDRSMTALKHLYCLPYCGPIDPTTLAKLEKIRLTEIAHDSVYEMRSTQDPVPHAPLLMNQIMGRKELLKELSESIFGILKDNGIELGENEGCVFTPILFETPIFAQKVTSSEKLSKIHGFGPQVYASPTSQSTPTIQVRPFAGVIEHGDVKTVGVVVDSWWWIGIPAPEILSALDAVREYNKQ